MIAYVDTPPQIDLSGEHFVLMIASGGECVQFMLTAKAFYGLSHECIGAEAKRRIADMEAREKVVPFPKKKATRTKR
jgi:hypothetical protein